MIQNCTADLGADERNPFSNSILDVHCLPKQNKNKTKQKNVFFRTIGEGRIPTTLLVRFAFLFLGSGDL